MESITIRPLIYILSLENSKYYVGITYNLNLRLAQHSSGQGAKWTQTHKPKKIFKVIQASTKEDEILHTLLMMKRFGYENVRGACWCKDIVANNPLENEKYVNIISTYNKENENKEN